MISTVIYYIDIVTVLRVLLKVYNFVLDLFSQKLLKK